MKGKKTPATDTPETSVEGPSEQSQQPESLPPTSPLPVIEDDDSMETISFGTPLGTPQLQSISGIAHLSTPGKTAQTSRDGTQNISSHFGECTSEVDQTDLNSGIDIHSLPDSTSMRDTSQSGSLVHGLWTRVGNPRIRSHARALLEHCTSIPYFQCSNRR